MRGLPVHALNVHMGDAIAKFSVGQKNSDVCAWTRERLHCAWTRETYCNSLGWSINEPQCGMIASDNVTINQIPDTGGTSSCAEYSHEW